MTFSRKIFISVFLTTILLGSLLIWTAHSYVSNQTKEKFVSRYSVFGRVPILVEIGERLSRRDGFHFHSFMPPTRQARVARASRLSFHAA